MFGGECCCWNTASELYPLESQPFSLPSPIPQWPQGVGEPSGLMERAWALYGLLKGTAGLDGGRVPFSALLGGVTGIYVKKKRKKGTLLEFL